jgi:hypothetical protein
VTPSQKLERVVGIEPTHRPWEGHRLPLHHTRALESMRFERPFIASYARRRRVYEMTLIERASTIATVISEISASTVIKALAQRVNGMTSAGLKAVESVNER